MSASTIARTDWVVIFEATESTLIPRVLKDVAKPLQLTGARLGELGALTDHIAGRFDLRGRDERTPQQSAFEQVN